MDIYIYNICQVIISLVPPLTTIGYQNCSAIYKRQLFKSIDFFKVLDNVWLLVVHLRFFFYNENVACVVRGLCWNLFVPYRSLKYSSWLMIPLYSCSWVVKSALHLCLDSLLEIYILHLSIYICVCLSSDRRICQFLLKVWALFRFQYIPFLHIFLIPLELDIFQHWCSDLPSFIVGGRCWICQVFF